MIPPENLSYLTKFFSNLWKEEGFALSDFPQGRTFSLKTKKNPQPLGGDVTHIMKPGGIGPVENYPEEQPLWKTGNQRDNCGKLELFHILHRFVNSRYPHVEICE